MKRITVLLLLSALSLHLSAQVDIVSGVRVLDLDGTGEYRYDIRGVNTLRAHQQPLWIVDGVVMSTSPLESTQPFFQYGDNGFVMPSLQSPFLNGAEVESIEVLKNTSATALYGSKGAHGVIIVKTRKPAGERTAVNWSSQAGVSVSEIQSAAFSPAAYHTHNLSVGKAGKNTLFKLGAFVECANGVIMRTGTNKGGVSAMFESKKAAVFEFGGNVNLFARWASRQSGTAWYGAPSLTLAVRGIAPGGIDSWLAGYDNDSRLLRTSDHLFFNVKFASFLRWENSLSVDYQMFSRDIWYGEETAFGKAYDGAAAITTSALLTLDVQSRLLFSRYFDTHHLFKASLAFFYNTDVNRYNTMTGTRFVSKDLRAKGLTAMESKALIRHFNTELSRIGGHLHLHYDYKSMVGVDAGVGVEKALKTEVYPYVQAFGALAGFRLEAGFGISGSINTVPGIDENASNRGYASQRTTEYNVSLSKELFSKRLFLKAGYYDRKTEDALLKYYRKDLLSRIASKLAGRGVELDIKAAIVQTEKTALDLTVTADYHFNSVLEVAPEDAQGLPLNKYGMIANVNRVGAPVGSLYGYVLDSNLVATGEQAVLGNTIPRFTGGVKLDFRIGDFSAGALFNWAAEFNILNMNRMLASAQEYVSSAFVERGDYFKMSRLSAAYDIPLNSTWIRALAITASANNLFTLSRYSGWNPEVSSFGYHHSAHGLDYGSFPIVRTFLIGITAKF